MNKKASVVHVLVLLITIIVFVLGIMLAVNASKNQDIKHDKVCNQIGEKAGLEFLFQSHGRCGWGEACSYQCRFVDSNGEQVIKNVK